MVIVVDTENNGEAWWEAARNAARFLNPDSEVWQTWRKVRGTRLGQSASVTDSEATAFMSWAAALDGWEDGPEYAANPLLFCPDDDESEPA